jgi:ABC-type lipoprotein release transport system permease subunit
LTLLAVLLPVLILNLMWGFIGAMERSFFANVTLEIGHLQVRRSNGGEVLPLIWDLKTVLEALAATEGVAWHTFRLEVPALAASEDRSRGVLVQGVEPGPARRLGLMDEWVQEGDYLQDNKSGVAVAGVELLKALGLEVRDELVLLSSHPETGMGVALPKVIGVIQAPSPDLNRMIVQIPLEDARSLAKAPGAATSVVVLVEGVSGPWDAPKIDAVTAYLEAELGERFEVKTWRELRPEIVGLLEIIRPLTLIFMVVFFLLGGLVVANTLYLNVLERTRELGLIISLGTSRRRVLFIIMVEAFLIVGIGVIFGTIGGVGLIELMEGGFALPGYYEDFIGVIGMRPTLYPRITPAEIAASALLMMFVSLLGAWYPAWRASRLEPVEVMRFV